MVVEGKSLGMGLISALLLIIILTYYVILGIVLSSKLICTIDFSYVE